MIKQKLSKRILLGRGISIFFAVAGIKIFVGGWDNTFMFFMMAVVWQVFFGELWDPEEN